VIFFDKIVAQSSVALELATSFVGVETMQLKTGFRRSRRFGKIWRDGEGYINVLMNSMGVQCN
jgi:hypothetical protein